MPLYVRTLLVTGPPDEVEAVAARVTASTCASCTPGASCARPASSANGDGFLEIFEAADLHEAQSIAGSSPLVFDGLGTWWSASGPKRLGF